MLPPAPKTAIVVVSCIVYASFLVHLRLATSYSLEEVHPPGLPALEDQLQTVQGRAGGVRQGDGHCGREWRLHLQRLDAHPARRVARGVPAGDGDTPDARLPQHLPHYLSQCLAEDLGGARPGTYCAGSHGREATDGGLDPWIVRA